MTVAGNPLRERLVRRLIQLHVGLAAYGVGAALMLRGNLGLDPWDVFHQGLARLLGVGIGWIVIAVGALVLLAWIPLRQKPGYGTVANAVLIGLTMQATLAVLPAPRALAFRITFLVVGVALTGLATGLYIGAGLGPGPRDGLMTGLVARRPGRSIRLVRTLIEITVLAAGWLLGGTVGVGTLLYAVAIGPLAHVFIPMFTIRATDRRAQSAAVVPCGESAG